MLNIAVVMCIFFLFYISLEVFKRTCDIRREHTRKIAHIISAVLTIAMYPFVSKIEFVVATSLFTILFLISRSKKLLHSIHVQHYTTYGEVFYPLSLVILAVSYYHSPFVMMSAVCMLGFADGIAGAYDLKNKKRSLRGSFVFFLISVAILMSTYVFFIDHLDVPAIFKILLISLLVSIIEYASRYGTDNLTVPIASAVLLSLLF